MRHDDKCKTCPVCCDSDNLVTVFATLLGRASHTTRPNHDCGVMHHSPPLSRAWVHVQHLNRTLTFIFLFLHKQGAEDYPWLVDRVISPPPAAAAAAAPITRDHTHVLIV
jgi:hypothetical protein